MNLVDGIEAFVKIADLGSFAAAARELNISPSAVSKLVSKTEEELGTRLLNRNTRGLSLTPEGEMFLERSRVILDELTAAKEELSSVSGEPRGKLRVSMPYIPSFFLPLISRFMEQYSAVTLEVDLSDRLVDVVEEGFDAVIRVGQLSDSRLTARSLGNCAMNLVASPDYIRRYGIPACVEDLSSHICIEKIKAAFSANVSKPDKPVRGGSIGEQLQSYGFTGNGMFPWKGYAGFRFVEAKKEGEFDLVIVTHCNVIIVELKDWNHQPVTARGDTWYKGDMNMGRSPVSVTRAKKSL
ncbi:TPA: LysR family transcriptional regulator [Klebsiella pneumoniae]